MGQRNNIIYIYNKKHIKCRSILLMCVATKVHKTIIEKKLIKETKDRLQDEQNAFQKIIIYKIN